MGISCTGDRSAARPARCCGPGLAALLSLLIAGGGWAAEPFRQASAPSEPASAEPASAEAASAEAASAEAASAEAASAEAADPSIAEASPEPAVRHALLVAGLPGDDQHQQQFRTTVSAWQQWLIQDLGFAADHVTSLSGDGDAGFAGARKEHIRSAAESLRSRMGPQDAVWVLVLGHASYDGHRGWLHLPGPDLNDLELAELFAGIGCREQVFWLTHTCSGWFLRSLSRPDRMVITATEPDREFNETEFPQALVEVIQRSAENPDADGDGRVSLAELFVVVSARVEQRFAADNRAPTEHAQLDDDGDGRGTEAAELAEPAAAAAEVPLSLRRDGAVAGRLMLAWPPRAITAPLE